MNVVILCDTYYPHINPAANCIERYIPFLKKGNSITIVCPSTIVNKEPVNKDRYRIEFVSCIWNDLRSYCREKVETGENSVLTDFLYMLVRLWGVIKSFYAFPSRFSWLKKQYYLKLKEINKSQPIDVVISVSDPVCAHLAAMKFKIENPSVRWITYSTDPYSENPTLYKNIQFKRIRKKHNIETESSIYRTADYSIFTEELFELAKKISPDAESKIFCFPYVLSPIHSETESVQYNNEERISLVYAGSLRESIRNPETLLSIITRCDQLHLFLYTSGDCGHLFKKYKSDNITIEGLLPKDQYLSVILNKADVLVNICNTIDLQAPSKMLELLSTGKPVINFYYKQDSFYQMIEQYPLGLNIKQGDMQKNDVVQNFCIMKKGKKMRYEEVEALFPHNTIGDQVALLKSMISGTL